MKVVGYLALGWVCLVAIMWVAARLGVDLSGGSLCRGAPLRSAPTLTAGANTDPQQTAPRLPTAPTCSPAGSSHLAQQRRGRRAHLAAVVQALEEVAVGVHRDDDR